MNGLFCGQGIRSQLFSIQILVMHIDRIDLAVVIGTVIVDTAVHITAGRIDRNLIFPITQVAAASLLLNRA